MKHGGINVLEGGAFGETERCGCQLAGHLHAPGDRPAEHDRVQAIRQILDVLIDNAMIHGEGNVGLTASRLGQGAVIAVSDQGSTAVDPARIFVRRNEDAVGEGIGLALAQRLATAEALRLVVADAGPGVVFHLVFGGPSPRADGTR